MTIEEAIKILKEQQNEFNEHWIDYAGVNNAYNMAIRSLEAWEKIKEETENSIRHLSPEARSCMDHASDCMNEAKNRGIEIALDIINKHLAEVSE